MAGEKKLREFVAGIVEKYPTDGMITEEQAQEIIAYIEENSPKYTSGKNKGKNQIATLLNRHCEKGTVYPNGYVARDSLSIMFFYYRNGKNSDGASWFIDN